MRASPERRRLRFSFQINNVKDPTGLPAPPYDARWRRGAAYLVAPEFRVKQFVLKANNSIAVPPEGGRSGFYSEAFPVSTSYRTVLFTSELLDQLRPKAVEAGFYWRAHPLVNRLFRAFSSGRLAG